MRRQVVINFEDDYVWAYPVDSRDYGEMFGHYFPIGSVDLERNTFVSITETVWQSDDLYPPLAVQDKKILSIYIQELN